MKEIDFIKRYHLSGLKENLLKVLDPKEKNLEKLLNSVMEFETHFKNYEVRKNRESDKILFSKDNFLENRYDSLILTESENYVGEEINFKKSKSQEKNPLISLAYLLIKGNYNPRIRIIYIQSTNIMSEQLYSSLKSKLGVNAYELLLAQFLFRLSPVLNLNSGIDIRSDSPCHKNNVYQRLRDRFWDRNNYLNPKKERVIQLLGKDNSWINFLENNI